jgi:hypothetical protein
MRRGEPHGGISEHVVVERIAFLRGVRGAWLVAED